MKLLYLSSPGGGLETNVRVLAPALVEAGHQVHILYIHFPGENLATPTETWRGCQVHHIRLGDWHYYAARATLGLSSLPSLLRAWEYGRALGAFVRALHQRVGLDLAEIPEGFVPKGSFGPVPYLVRLHSSAWMCRILFGDRIPFADRFERQMEAQTLARARGLSSPSAFVADYVRAACNVRQPIHIIPYPIDTAQFRPGPKAPQPLVLFVGRVEKRKGADTLLQALPQVLAQCPDCEFVFVGRLCDDTAELVKAAPPPAKFLGPRPREEVLQWLQRAWAFAAPSVWDNSPNTVYEALACGTAVVATRVGGIPELVEDGATGLLVAPGDSSALAATLLGALKHSAQRGQFEQAGRAKAQAQFALPVILAQTLNLYAHLLNRPA